MPAFCPVGSQMLPFQQIIPKRIFLCVLAGISTFFKVGFVRRFVKGVHIAIILSELLLRKEKGVTGIVGGCTQWQGTDHLGDGLRVKCQAFEQGTHRLRHF